jgi:hypothetical protein
LQQRLGREVVFSANARISHAGAGSIPWKAYR